MRITETSRLIVSDVLHPSGRPRSEISMRAEITKNNIQRLAYLTNPKLIAAFNRYVEWRKAKRFGCSLDGRRYRGLMPQTLDLDVEGRTLRTQHQAGQKYGWRDCLLQGGRQSANLR